MIDIDNQSDYAPHTHKLEEILKAHSTKEIELLIIDDANMREINLQQRGIDKTTDVLSFPLDNMPLLGTVIINIDYVKRSSERFGHSVDDEFVLMFIHGLLHLLGYDHETDKGQMRALEEKLISTYKLPASLIVRVEDIQE